MSVCAFTCVCQEDVRWLPGYVAEAERMGMEFVLLYDRMKPEETANHQLCRGVLTRETGEFNEQAKQPLMDLVKALGYDWAFAWDVDEVYAENAMNVIWLLEAWKDTDCFDTRWLNAWGDRDHIRVDERYAIGHRVKLYNMTGGRTWVFDHPITNGPKLQGRAGTIGQAMDLVCIHLGMMTGELRRMHKERWDRIYSTALRGDPNPYGFWKWMIETEDQAVAIKHGYFQGAQ